MARIRSHGEEAEAQNAGSTALAFTADDGRLLAVLAGEGQARRRGNALRPGWRPVHTHGVLATGTFSATGEAGPSAPAHLRPGHEVTAVARFSSCQARLDGDDRRHGPRGLAVRFTLDTGVSTRPGHDEHRSVHRRQPFGVRIRLQGDEQSPGAAPDPPRLAHSGPSASGAVDVSGLLSAIQLCAV